MLRADEVKKQLSRIAESSALLDVLVEFEQVLDNAHLYSYKNWFGGEIVDGPVIERHWVTCKIMYPEKLMPDPDGGMRLIKAGAKVYFEKATFLVPLPSVKNGVVVRYTGKRQVKKHPVWVISIKIPKRLIDEKILDKIEYKYSDPVDTSDVSEAYDANFEEGEE